MKTVQTEENRIPEESEKGAGSAQQHGFSNRITIEKLRQIWNDGTIQYADKQLLKIRDWLYIITSVMLKADPRYHSVVDNQPASQNKDETEPFLLTIQNPKSDATKKSNSVHPCEYRRAG